MTVDIHSWKGELNVRFSSILNITEHIQEDGNGIAGVTLSTTEV